MFLWGGKDAAAANTTQEENTNELKRSVYMKLAFAGLRHSHIIGMYKQALAHEGIEVVGAYEQQEEAREAAKQAGLDVCFDSYEALLAVPGLDAVAFGGCYGDRGKMEIQALEAGKHIIGDKPLCTSLDELDQIQRLSEQKGLRVSCALTLRYSPCALAAKKLIEDGVLGNVQAVYMGGQHPYRKDDRPKWYYDPQKHGGTINDIGIHSIDLVRFLTGAGIAKIQAARCWNSRPEVAPLFKESGQFMVTLENGAGMMGDMSYQIPDSFGFKFPLYWRISIWGVNGVIEYYAASDHVTLYENGKTEPQLIPGIAPQSDFYSDFMDDICGRPAALNTREVLRSQREALMVQAAADRA